MNILFFLKPKSEVAYIYDYHTVRQALEIMEYHKYSCIPILDREGRYKGSITEGDLLWGLKTKNLFSIKETEGINVMKIHRRNDYQYVTSNAKMEDQRDLLLASWETPNYVKISHFQEFQIV